MVNHTLLRQFSELKMSELNCCNSQLGKKYLFLDCESIEPIQYSSEIMVFPGFKKVDSKLSDCILRMPHRYILANPCTYKKVIYTKFEQGVGMRLQKYRNKRSKNISL